MEKPLVSVIIPVYNNEKYLDKCIKSVCNQKYDNLEIILINDGSEDHSQSILEKWAGKDKRIVLISQENKGVSVARNAGLDRASGEYITFIDGDDYVGPMYIFRMLASALKYGSDMVISGLLMERPDGTVIRSIIPGRYEKARHEEWTFRMSAVACHLYKRSLWEESGIRFYPGVRGEDMPVALFFSAACQNISLVRRADYYYVQHESSAMHSFKKRDKSFLPYEALEESIKKVQEFFRDDAEKKRADNDSHIKRKQFHELFVLRILSTMIDIARGATKEEASQLADYIKRILDTFYPECYRNPLTGLFSRLDIPFGQKAAVKVLATAYKMNMIKILVYIMCKIR